MMLSPVAPPKSLSAYDRPGGLLELDTKPSPGCTTMPCAAIARSSLRTVDAHLSRATAGPNRFYAPAPRAALPRLHPLLAENLIGPLDQRHQIRRRHEAGILAVKV